MKINNYFTKTIRYLCYFFAFVIVAMALLVTVARLSTPLLNHYKRHFESWVSYKFKVPVKIGHVHADWIGYRPELLFDHVDILSKDKSASILHLNSLDLSIDLFHTFVTRKIKFKGVYVTGVKLAVKLLPNNKIAIIGMNDVKVNGQGSSGLKWFMGQPNWFFKDSEINFFENDTQHSWIHLNSLVVHNRKNRHQLYGIFFEDDKYRSELDLNVILKGDSVNLSDDDVQIYVKAKDLFLNQWLLNKNFFGYQIKNGILSGKVWARFNGGKVSSVQSLLDLNHLILLSQGNKTLYLKHFSGNVMWKQIPFGWEFSGDNVNLVSRSAEWNKNQFVIQTTNINNNEQQHLWLNYLDLHDTKQFLLNSSLISSDLKEKIAEFSPSGDLFNVGFDSSTDNGYHFYSEFSNLSTNQYKKFPSFMNLTGAIDLFPTSGEVKINSANVASNFFIYSKAKKIDYLSGNILWQRLGNNNWFVHSEQINAVNSDAAVKCQFGLLLAKKSSPVLNLLAGIHFNNAVKLKSYWPEKYISPKLKKWLMQAFLKSDSIDDTLVINGAISDFPFDRGRAGTFVNSIKIQNMDFRFANNWPILNNIYGEVVINKRRFDAFIDGGSFVGSDIQNLHAAIPYLGHETKPHELTINANINSTAKSLFAFLRASPLKNSVGKALKPLYVDGLAPLELKLMIPIGEFSKTKVKGKISLSNVTAKIPANNIVFNQTNGNIIFSKEKVFSNNLNANLFNFPARITINSINSGKNKKTNISISSKISMATLTKYLHLSQPEFLSGTTSYNAELNIFPDQKEKQNLLAIKSDLNGIKFKLPDALGKNANSKMAFNANLYFGNNQFTKLFLNFKNKLSAALLFKPDEKNENHLFGTKIHVGNSNATLSKNSGLFFDGEISKVTQNTITDFVVFANQQKNISNQGGSDFAKQFKSAHFQVDDIDLFNQRFQNSIVDITPENDSWLVGIHNNSIDGDLVFPEKIGELPIIGNFSKIILAKEKSSNYKKIVNPGVIPALQINADQFQYDDHAFGKMVLKSHPDNNEFVLDQLNFSAPFLSTNLRGYWKLNSAKKYSSEIKGDFESKDFNYLLNSFNIHSSLLAQTSKANVDLSWPDSIFNFSIKNLSGNINTELGHGWLVDLGEDADNKLNLGRLITFLSVNRLIEMNFADMAHEGYGFDKMQGDFSIQNGKINTNDLVFDGTTAAINVKGSIATNSHLLDLRVEVLPHVTSSLPVIATVIGGPVAGAVTWVANKIFGKAISKKLAKYDYKITGKWNQPEIKKIATTTSG